MTSTGCIPSPRILLGPGPSSVSNRVLAALGRPPIGYLDPELFTLLHELREKLRTVFGTANDFTIPLTGTGMAGMEFCLVNLLEPGDEIVIGVNGFFGARMVEIATRIGASVTRVDSEWGKIIEPEQIAQALRNVKSPKAVACVHAETSTGVRTPLFEIGKLAHEHEALFLVDAVTSLGGIPVEIDKNGIDACYSATQKCMGAPPGLSPVTFSQSALTVVEKRKSTVPNWYYDLKLIKSYFYEPHAYHHTVPVNLYYALAESLEEILEEGLETRFERHRTVSEKLISGLALLGVHPFAQDGHRLPTLNSVIIPPGVQDEIAIRKRLLLEYGLEIGGGLGELKGKIWRIGTMGTSATLRNVSLLLTALAESLS